MSDSDHEDEPGDPCNGCPLECADCVYPGRVPPCERRRMEREREEAYINGQG